MDSKTVGLDYLNKNTRVEKPKYIQTISKDTFGESK